MQIHLPRGADRQDHDPWTEFPHLLLLGIASGGLLVRLIWIHFFGLVIEFEGADYARLGESLLAGRGYVGMFGGPHTVFPPLYPALIGLFTSVAGSAEGAARWISCLSGVALIWPVYGITQALGGRRSATVAAVLVALHGLLISLSSSAYSESTYFVFLLSGLYFALRSLSGDSLLTAVLSGAFYALAYLVRPEAVLYVAITAVFLTGNALVARQKLRRAALQAGVLILTSVILAAPYVTWLSVNSGYLRWEGKSLSTGIIARRMRQGMSYLEASRGLGPNLEQAGPYLVANQFEVPGDGAASARLSLETISSDFLPRIVEVGREFAGSWPVGGPGMVILAVIGALAAFAQRRHRALKLFFFCAGLGYVFTVLILQQRWMRHLFPLTYFLLPWAAVGVATLATFIARAIPGETAGTRLRQTGTALATVILTALLVVPSIASVRTLGEFSQSSDLTLKAAGTWLRDAGAEDKRIMGLNAVIAYYAGASYSVLPWASDEQALAYIRRRQPDFIVLQTDLEYNAPYLPSWTTNGIPDPCAVKGMYWERRQTGRSRFTSGHAASGA